jgi:RHS repeat-associated protein
MTSTTYYLYDALGRRIMKSTGYSGDVRTYFVYDGWNLVAEYTGANHYIGTPPAITLIRTHAWGTDVSGSGQGAGGVGGLLATYIATGSPTGFYCPTFDGNGNVSEYIYDYYGTVAAHFEYDPFGRTLVDTDTNNRFPLRFSTKYRDVETGLYYYGYRYFDPLTGRWPSRDPIEERRGGPNLYGMCENNPINLWDLLGLDTYLARRTLGGGPAKSIGDFFAHQFAFVVDASSGKITTYSWGNTPTDYDGGSNKWFADMPEDIAAAREALSKGLARRQGGEDLDKCMGKAFAELADETRVTASDHFNWGVTSNCKTESCKLIDKAKSILKSTK